MFIKIWLQIELVINMFKEFQQLKTPVELPLRFRILMVFTLAI